MITIPGQLAIETRRGRYGNFNVGQLRTSIGQFAVKDPELDQYTEGKYDGEFVVVEIRQQTYATNGRIVSEMRAYLGGMTLSNIDALTKDDAQRLAAQEPDPIDQEPKVATTAGPPPAATPVTEPAAQTDSTPESSPSNASATAALAPAKTSGDDADSQLFGPLWPLAVRFKLDTTIDRRLIRQQCGRLDALNYDFDPKTQEWYRKAA